MAAQADGVEEIFVAHQGRHLGPAENQWGRSESLDPDNVGDIADEGAGHRG
jgi:hypothetical protein